MSESAQPTESASPGVRLRERLGSVSPWSLTLLGFVGLLGDTIPRLEVLQLFHVFWLFALWPFASMVLGTVTGALGDEETDEVDPREWLVMDAGWGGQLAFLLGIPLSVVNPLMFRQDAMQLLGSLVAIGRHRGALPGPETFEQSASYRLPVEETWTVVNGSPIKDWSHSWFPATQRYAYDFVITDDEGRTHPVDTDTSIENYYCYDEPVLAPADGVVVDVHDGDPEFGRGGGYSHPAKRSVTGNTVTIRHAEGEYSCLAHLIPGSIDVAPGDRVAQGQPIGRCGHSGNSSEPHLHFQLQDHPTFEISAGLPIQFDDVATETPGADVTETGDWTPQESGRNRDVDESVGAGHQYVHVGQRVTHAPGESTPNGDGTRPTERRSESIERDQIAESGDAASGATEPRTSDRETLSGLPALARVGGGVAIGGHLLILAGFVASSLATIAIGIGGIAAVAIAGLGAQGRFGRGRVRTGAVATAVGTALSAGLIGAIDYWALLPGMRTFDLGALVFLTGFALYVAVWEGGRLRVLRGLVSRPEGKSSG